MTDEQKQTPPNDWSQLAKDALDIWQNHLTSLATDPKAKEEMARFVTPMTEAMAGWSNVVQQGMQQMMQMATSAAEQAQEAYAAAQAQQPQSEPEAPSAPPQEPPQEPPQAAPEASPDETPQPAAEPQPDVTEESVSHEQSVPVSPALAADAGLGPIVSPISEPAPVVESAAESAAEPEPVATAEPAPESRRAASSDGSRSLAELAGRLAVLERELDQLRPRPRRKDAAAEPGSDGADERVARADPKPDTL